MNARLHVLIMFFLVIFVSCHEEYQYPFALNKAIEYFYIENKNDNNEYIDKMKRFLNCLNNKNYDEALNIIGEFKLVIRNTFMSVIDITKETLNNENVPPEV